MAEAQRMESLYSSCFRKALLGEQPEDIRFEEIPMPIVNFGSINLDFVYRVERLVAPGETIHALSQERFAGGKGFNQSIALARAGARVRHVGKVGEDGRWLVEMLKEEGVETRDIDYAAIPTGHAIIQVDARGENSILVHGGANREFTQDALARACSTLNREDWVLLQNETNAPARVIESAARKGSRVVFNPSPLDASILDLPLGRVDTFLVNRVEGQGLSGESEPDRILDAMQERYPNAATVLTLGDQGVVYARGSVRLKTAAESVQAVDTTGAGDTFAGYWLAETASSGDPERALRLACRAAADCVGRPGAAASIPRRSALGPPH
jgi:ribokinase